MMLLSVIAVVGGVVWLGTVVAGFLALSRARTPLAGTVLPVSPLAIAAAAVALGSAFLGPGVVVGQLVALVLAVVARRDESPPSRVLAHWVIVWASTLLTTVLLVAGCFLAVRPDIPR